MRTWGLCVVPLVGLVELGAHVVQTRSVVSEADWHAAREAVRAEARPDDLVIFAPAWTEPVGRMVFGDDVATLERMAFPDESRFARAFEVSTRGGRRAEVAAWPVVAERRIGRITLLTRKNPSYAPLRDDLARKLSPAELTVTSLDGSARDCTFIHGAPQAGGLGFGTTIPGDRFLCNDGSFVGLSVVTDLEYHPHRCVAAPPSGRGVLRLRFASVAFGKTLRGHHGLYVEAERGRDGTPVTIALRSGDRALGRFTHNDGDGWKPFEIDTSDLANSTGELVVEIATSNGARRQYCFEAITR